MQRPDSLDAQAQARAQLYMGAVAWPTVIFALAVFTAYAVTVVLALTGTLTLWLATPLVGVLTYLSYTVLHESAHGSISGSQQHMRWLNEALGYAAAWILMIPLTAHRHEHLAHHRHTNDPEGDPDFHVSDIRRSPLRTCSGVMKVFAEQYRYYLSHRWQRGPARQNANFCLEIAAIVLPRLALVAAGYGEEVVCLFLIGWLGGVSLTLYLFAYLVHRPHQATGRYMDTSTVLAPAPFNRIVSWLWVFQNYHSIHHLFPRVPFYQYPKLFDDIESIMIEKGAPIFSLEWSGMRPRYRLSTEAINCSHTPRPSAS
jgi:beta-carotene hydroxylase